jgi:hypothetical protein
MALRDTGLIEFAQLIANEELTTAFVREHGLLLSEFELDGLNYNNNNNNHCALGGH